MSMTIDVPPGPFIAPRAGTLEVIGVCRKSLALRFCSAEPRNRGGRIFLLSVGERIEERGNEWAGHDR